MIHKNIYDLGFKRYKKDKTASRNARAERASKHCETKQEAIKEARKISRNQKTELIIHNLDGKINQKDSHGNDTLPPKG